MDAGLVLLTAAGLVVLGAVARIVWRTRPDGVAAALTVTGRQEATIVVKGGYSPDVIVVRANTPVRLNFRREEATAGSDMVLLPAFGRSAQLPQGETVPLDFTPQTSGEYEFTCRSGLLRGRLVVRGG